MGSEQALFVYAVGCATVILAGVIVVTVWKVGDALEKLAKLLAKAIPEETPSSRRVIAVEYGSPGKPTARRFLVDRPLARQDREAELPPVLRSSNEGARPVSQTEDDDPVHTRETPVSARPAEIAAETEETDGAPTRFYQRGDIGPDSARTLCSAGEKRRPKA